MDTPSATPDRSSPETTITDRPKKRVKTRRKKAKVTFEFTASEPGCYVPRYHAGAVRAS